MVAQAEVKLQNPGLLFETAWNYQEQLLGLQDDINESIEEVVTAVSTILKSSTQETLGQYELLYDDIDDIYAPLLVGFNALKPSDCRDTAERALNDTTQFAGFDASICAQTYDDDVRMSIAAANRALSGIDGLYSQVQLIVVKSFIGKNAFTMSDDIEDTIAKIFELVSNRWANSKPDLESLKSRLAAEIAGKNKELGECNVQISDDVASLSGRFQRMVQTCVTFNSTPSKTKSVDMLSGNAIPSYKQQLAEYQEELSKLRSNKFSS